MTKKEILRILDSFNGKGSKEELLNKIIDSGGDLSDFDELCLLGLIKLGGNDKGVTWGTTDFGEKQIDFYRPLAAKERKSGLRFYSMVYGR